MADIMTRLTDRPAPKIEVPAEEAVAFDFLCGATKQPFTAEMTKVGPGFMFRRFAPPEAARGATGWGPAPSAKVPSRALVQGVSINRLNLAGQSCPCCQVPLDGFIRCGRCDKLVCESAITSHSSPVGQTAKWFACPCGCASWMGSGGDAETAIVTGRKCDAVADNIKLPLREVPRAVNGLLRLPPPAKGRS